jgi:hypothetical protein
MISIFVDKHKTPSLEKLGVLFLVSQLRLVERVGRIGAARWEVTWEGVEQGHKV